MKPQVGSGTRFSRRPYFTDAEIERTATEALDAVQLLPGSPQPVRIERFVEKRFGPCVRYDTLDHGLLGITVFGPNGVEEIIISRALSEESSAVSERRINTTLAHEAGHGLLHAQLFTPEIFSPSLFDAPADVTPIRILCREHDAVSLRQPRYDGRWWEFQANRMMGALLLPLSLVRSCLGGTLVREGAFGQEFLPESARHEATRLLANVFDVNRIVARIRIQTLYPQTFDNQLTL